MLEFIGFADFANLAEIEPPLPTIEELSVSGNSFVFYRIATALFRDSYNMKVRTHNYNYSCGIM